MKKSVAFLKRHPPFTELIREHGVPKIARRGNAFRSLTRAIIYQQVSGTAAAAILKRFRALFETEFPTPDAVRATSVAKLRSAGLSKQKASYLKDLAEKCADGTVKSRALARMTNDEIIEHLIQVKGIGTWTVHMFLIFTLGRPDVLPTGDLGIQKGFQSAFKLTRLPDHATMERLAKPWRAHASLASWYLWRVADGMKKSNW
jgi:DNA-3-methyladenine glycosylase II